MSRCCRAWNIMLFHTGVIAVIAVLQYQAGFQHKRAVVLFYLDYIPTIALF
jgi:hypothetical protein